MDRTKTSWIRGFDFGSLAILYVIWPDVDSEDCVYPTSTLSVTGFMTIDYRVSPDDFQGLVLAKVAIQK